MDIGKNATIANLPAISMPALVGLVALAVGCGTSPKQFMSYPTQKIERPYTVPTWLSTLEMGAVSQLTPQAETRLSWAPLVKWSTALGSPNWTLDGALIFPGVRYQALRNKTQMLGVRVGTNGFGRSSTLGFLLAGGGAVSYWHRLAAAVDWRTSIFVDYILRTKAANGWQTSLRSGPLLQVSDRVSLRPWIGLVYGDIDLEMPEQGAGLTGAPAGVEFEWNLHPSWGAQVGYMLHYLGYDETSHVAYVVALYYY